MTPPWRCGSALAAAFALGCAAAPAPAPLPEFAALEAASRDPCRPARDEDFEGDGEAALRGYVDWLARTHGPLAALSPRDVSLVIVRGEPKPGPAGVTGGEVSCALDYGAPYRITLYRDALVGRRLETAYTVVAHEFQHVLQIRRDRLPCGASGEQREHYEREATDVAARLAPACR